MDFAGQRWRQRGEKGLTFFLRHSRLIPGRVSFNVTITFVPPWLEEDDILPENAETLKGAAAFSFQDFRISAFALRSWLYLVGIFADLFSHESTSAIA